MNLLLSNDDGYLAPGLASLAESMSRIGNITVVAPDRNRSGASNSLTLDVPVHARTDERGFIYVDGTPTDCVHLAITGLLTEEPDMVVSGINAGANMGDDVLYSGTVAAATEGRFLGLPSIAISLVLDGKEHYDSAAEVALQLIRGMPDMQVPADTILNVNVPDLPLNEIKGIRATRLGYRHKAEPVIRSKDPRGETIYWVGPPGAEQDAGSGTDFYAVRNGYVSVTPLSVDLTRHSSIEDTRVWLAGLDLD
jgi:5'-nucleotidase